MVESPHLGSEFHHLPRNLKAEDLSEDLSNDELSRGIKAGVVPGLFGGWVAALDRFGTMSLKEVLEPGIDYAENGHPIERSVVSGIRGLKDIFEKYPTSRRVFLPNGQVPALD